MLGEYKLNEIYNEDCYEAIKKIPDKSVDCIYVDVPYEYVNGGTSESDLGDRFAKKRKILKEKNIYNGFDYNLLQEFIRIMKYINIFIWCSRLQLLDIMNYFSNKNCNFELLTWNKTNPQPGCNNTWLSDIEYCLYFREIGKVKLNDGYELKSKWYISPINKADKDLYDHPTIKPLELVKRHLLHATQPGGIVMDCFLGSGTTAVACQETDRKYIGFEIDKQYYEIAKKRLNGITADGQLSIFTDIDKLNEELFKNDN
jgi:DNA modification methylase